MSDEVQEGIKEETGKKITEEKNDSAKKIEQESTGDKKKKKINKLSIEELNNKINELESNNTNKSKYYLHLKQRKNELDKENETVS